MTRYSTGLMTAVLLSVTLSVTGQPFTGSSVFEAGNGRGLTATIPSGLGAGEKIANLAYTSMDKEKGKYSRKAKSLFNGFMEHVGNHSH